MGYTIFWESHVWSIQDDALMKQDLNDSAPLWFVQEVERKIHIVCPAEISVSTLASAGEVCVPLFM
jgi:hypothetical protein